MLDCLANRMEQRNIRQMVRTPFLGYVTKRGVFCCARNKKSVVTLERLLPIRRVLLMSKRGARI